MLKFLRLFFSFISLVVLSACSTTDADPAVVFRGQSAQQVFQKGELALTRHKYKDATQAFEGLTTLYPFSTYAEEARLHLIYAYYEDDAYASVVEAADQFIRLYPGSPNIDYVYYLRGLANFNQDRGWFLRYAAVDLSMRDPGTMYQAYADFKHVVELYPDSRYAPNARQRMVYLRNLFAARELDVASYYFKHKAYVAAANRASYLVKHYNGSPQVQPALVILMESYRKLGLDDLANETSRVLRLNYPQKNRQ